MKLVQPVGREFKEEVADYSTIRSACRCSSPTYFQKGYDRMDGYYCRCADVYNGTVGLRVNIG